MKKEYNNKQIKSTDESVEKTVPVANKAYFVPEHSVTVEADSTAEVENIINQEK